MPQLDTDATLDGQLELKKRSRRRLVGAAALALLAIIVLPMVMDHEPRQPAQDVQVRIPSQDGGIAAKILPNKTAPTPLPPSPPDSAADSRPEAVAEKPPVVIPRDEKPAAEQPVEKPAAKPAEKPAEKVSERAVSNAEELRARAALAGVEVSEPWLVLIGAYRDAANVKQLTGKLKQIGVPTITEHFDSPQGPRTRVRAGPFKSRVEAEQALAKMKKIGVDGLVKQSGK
jgi:DedD protein